MKVLLIQPRMPLQSINFGDSMLEPLPLEYIASGIIDEHNVKILDMRIDENLDRMLRDFKPDIIGITSFTVHVNVVKNLFKKIKTINPDIFTVVGGHHATAAPEDFLISDIDLVVIGEGVFVFKEIVLRIKEQKGFDGISGIAYLKNSKPVIIPPEQITDMDLIPFPARDITNQYRKNYFFGWMKPVASIRTSKGCPFRCNFCALWKNTGGKYYKRKPENIVKELSEIKERNVFFADDESLIDSNRMEILAKYIKDAGIKKSYFMYGRADTIVKNPEVIKLWKDIGLETIFIGFEAFRNKDLENINKKTTIETYEKAIELLNSIGIGISASFIVKPEYTKEDFIELKEYCRKMNLALVSFTVMTPLPGTDFYEETKDKFITTNYDLFDLFHPVTSTNLPMQDFFDSLATLLETHRTPAQNLSLLRKFPLLKIPSLMNNSIQMSKVMRNAYKNYENIG